MSDVLVLGGGICGLATAMLLARDGHSVRVVERDPEEVPGTVDEAWHAWNRRGVAQFRQTHNLHPRVRLLLEAELPDVRASLVRHGAYRMDMLSGLPPMITDRDPRPGDDRFLTDTARRSTAEYTFADAARNEPRVVIERGVKVVGVLTGPSAVDGVPHVRGAVTSDGREIRADLVVDAMGRRSKIGGWLTAAGGQPPYEEAEDSGFTYYTVYFTGSLPPLLGPAVTEFGTISFITLPADNHVWAITIWCASGDQPLKALRNLETFKRVVALSPRQAPWLDGEPVTEVLAMSGVVDRYRRFVVDGKPVVTGMVAVADAWACTNPSAGRGISLGLAHGIRLRDTFRESAGDPVGLAQAFHEITETELAPWYTSQIRTDRRRYQTMDALRQGRPPPPPATDEYSQRERLFWQAMPFDPDLFRAAMEIISALTLPRDIYARPGVMDRAEAVVSQLAGDASPVPSASRADLLAAMS
jgi:2-polyprenyl-6-methoxyphenol hydroxylase-like FAD-dependent oxidoreductase